MVYKKPQVPYSLVIPDPSFSMVFNGFWAVTDQKMAQSGSKIMKCELILNVNGLPAQKIGIIAPKAGKTQKLVKSLVNPDMRTRGV
jgi:hypothetical protein